MEQLSLSDFIVAEFAGFSDAEVSSDPVSPLRAPNPGHNAPEKEKKNLKNAQKCIKTYNGQNKYINFSQQFYKHCAVLQMMMTTVSTKMNWTSSMRYWVRHASLGIVDDTSSWNVLAYDSSMNLLDFCLSKISLDI